MKYPILMLIIITLQSLALQISLELLNSTELLHFHGALCGMLKQICVPQANREHSKLYIYIYNKKSQENLPQLELNLADIIPHCVLTKVLQNGMI